MAMSDGGVTREDIRAALMDARPGDRLTVSFTDEDGVHQVSVYVADNLSEPGVNRYDRGDIAVDVELGDDDRERLDLPSVTADIRAREERDGWTDPTLAVYDPYYDEDGEAVHQYTAVGPVVAVEDADTDDEDANPGDGDE